MCVLQVAKQQFDTSSRWVNKYFGSNLMSIMWVDIVFHWVRTRVFCVCRV